MATPVCPACTKKVYPVDKSINLDGNIYHNPCAKCADCNCQISLSNFTLTDQPDGKLLLCKTHYMDRFHKGEGYGGGEKFKGKSPDTNGKLAGSAITKIKSTTSCKICAKSLYPNDPQLNVDGTLFHKTCAKCQDCDCQITLSNFAAINAEEYVLLCKTHYNKRFSESGGSYPGGEKFNVKNVRDIRAASVAEAAKDPVRSSDAQSDFSSKAKVSSTKEETDSTMASADSEDVGPISVEE